MPVNYDTANERIEKKALEMESQMKEQMISLGIRHVSYSPSPKAAIKSLKTSFRKAIGLISRISFKIPKHMIYVHKGVGKGTPIEMAGTTNRKAKPWFDPVVENNIEELADIVAEETGNAIVNNLLIR